MSVLNFTCQSMLRTLLAGLLIIQLVSCAKRYHPLQPQNLNYQNIQYTDGIGLSYIYNTLTLDENKKYYKKAKRKDIRLVAVKITNRYDFSVNVRRDLQFFAYNMPIEPLEAQITYNALKQRALLYGLYGFIFIPVNTYNSGKIWIPLGLPFAIWNIGIATGANNKFRTELEVFNIRNKILQPGASAVGLIAIKDDDYPELSVRLK